MNHILIKFNLSELRGWSWNFCHPIFWDQFKGWVFAFLIALCLLLTGGGMMAKLISNPPAPTGSTRPCQRDLPVPGGPSGTSLSPWVPGAPTGWEDGGQAKGGFALPLRPTGRLSTGPGIFRGFPFRTPIPSLDTTSPANEPKGALFVCASCMRWAGGAASIF